MEERDEVAFRRTVGKVFKRLMGGEPPREYVDQIVALNDACGAWYEAHPGAVVHLKVPQWGGPNGTVMTGNLDLADKIGFCLNDNARDLIRYVDERTGRTATLLMLQVCVFIQRGLVETKGAQN